MDPPTEPAESGWGAALRDLNVNVSGPPGDGSNHSGEAQPSPSAVRTVAIPVIYLLVCAGGLGGNSLVIYVVLRFAKMKTVTNIYILNLAVADVLFMLGLPFIAAQNALSYWPFGSALCRLVMAVDGINQFTSVFCLTVMSLDRYLAVVHPLKAAGWRRPPVAKLISAAVWAFSLLMSLPVIIFVDVQEVWNTCNISWPEPADVWGAVFIIYTAALGFFGPLLVICICHLLIVIKVRAAGARAGAGRRRRSERKVTRMVVVVVAAFVLCWLPFFTLNIANAVFPLPEEHSSDGLYFFVVVLSYANSCANPVLYGFLSDNFRESFRRALGLRRSLGLGTGGPADPRPDKSGHLRTTALLAGGSRVNGHMQTSQL
ncbi:somatostatin receptor type 5 [Ornithorhynchus anatinus]|uniref:somatostatin receptor type 5 n=1 Tax=Ornithorhynchus anatinus TaxID=9258 RepID=UPI0010A9454F|nr:somatostatin receptor type 5 [Ornithorhynchus anatinus]